MKFRKKPVVVEAIQWDGQENTFDRIRVMCKDRDVVESGSCQLEIETLEGVHFANPGDWIIKGVRGELYPIKNDIFLETYEKVLD